MAQVQMISPCSFRLVEGHVHVWTVHGASDAVAAEMLRTLSPDEKQRAARFRYDDLRCSFVIAHGSLRRLLGSYLGAEPASIRFGYGSRGKPYLISPAGIEFNMSHSGDVTAFAFALGVQLGIDVERMRPMLEMQETADQFFCPEEAAELLSLPADQRERAFFSCWTRKEAYVKALGVGLSLPLNRFRVTVGAGNPASVLHIDQNLTAGKSWTLHDLHLAPDYAATLAYPGNRRLLQMVDIADPAVITYPLQRFAREISRF